MNPGKVEGPIIFFDGVCALCNAFVDFMISRDTRARFRFAPLQGETYAERVVKAGLEGPATSASASRSASAPFDTSGGDGDWMRSLVLADADGLHRKSDAALRVVQGLGGVWTMVGALRVVPRFMRDMAYDFLARNRYRWFGKRDACRMPSPAERERFLP